MKKLLLFLMLIMACVSATAQDVIVKKDGSTVLCKIIQVNGNEVIYLKWSDLKGPQYIMDSSLVSNINYQDGRQDKLNEPTENSYAPGIQQSGAAQYNDNALLAMDKARNNYSPYLQKAKKLKVIGWSVGSSIVICGVGVMVVGLLQSRRSDAEAITTIGGIVALGGIATTTGCLIRAHQLKNKATQIAIAPVLQKEFNFGDGTSLSAGIDMIRDNQFKNTTFGLGLQFNF